MDKEKLDDLEQWINAYDLPIDRTCVADMFYELKSELEELERVNIVLREYNGLYLNRNVELKKELDKYKGLEKRCQALEYQLKEANRIIKEWETGYFEKKMTKKS